MKKRPLFSLLTGSLLIFSSGCGFLPGGGGDESVVSPDIQENPPPEIPIKSARALPPVDMASLGLIAPVLPDQRLRQIQPGRTNPFELIPVEATIRQPASSINAAGAGANTNGNGVNGNGGKMGVNGTVNASNSADFPPGKDGVDLASPDVKPIRIYPDAARAVVVSGIIEIGNRPFAIVQAPGEPVARNVTVGDRLSGGRVRVESINAFGGNPSVVLEQNGDSVTRNVGSPALPPLTALPVEATPPPTGS